MNVREQIAAIDAEIQDLREVREAIILKAQNECPHPKEEILEGEGSPPFHVCKLCGYAEEGWYCGYWKLECRNAPRLSHREAFKYVLRFINNSKLADLRFSREAVS